jgi:hypothetical protein
MNNSTDDLQMCQMNENDAQRPKFGKNKQKAQYQGLCGDEMLLE